MDQKMASNERHTDDQGYQVSARPQRRGLYTVIAVIVLLTIAAFFVRNQWFRIKHVQIDGINRVPREEVLQLAGIDVNSTYFSLNEKKIAEGINANRYLAFVSMEKIWPDQVVLYVNERQPVANVLHMGVQYVLAGDGMVLETSGILTLDNGCIKVTGLNVRDIRIGSQIVCQNAAQLDVFKALLEELSMQQILPEVSELNLTSLESIYLVTMDGYTANIGDATELRAKIGTVRAVADELRRRNLTGGLIEATVPGQAAYRPVQ